MNIKSSNTFLTPTLVAFGAHTLNPTTIAMHVYSELHLSLSSNPRLFYTPKTFSFTPAVVSDFIICLLSVVFLEVLIEFERMN